MERRPRRVAVMLELHWPYKRHAAVFAGMQEYAEENGWHSIIDEFADHTLRRHTRETVPFDGIVARATPALAKQAARLRVPLVNVWPSSPIGRRVPGVFPDAVEAGRLCTEHLLSRGVRNFGTLTPQQNLHDERIVAEFLALSKKSGFPVAEAKIAQSPELDLTSWREAEAIIGRWMDSWKLPIGLFVAQENIGRLVVQICADRGWRVPHDVAIIAGQNQETLCEHPRPSLTSIEFGYERIGREAARLLDELMDGAHPPEAPILLPPQGLVVRESTDFIAVDDAIVSAALAYIAAHSHRRIGPNDVARAVGEEVRTLHNYFRRVLDRSIAAEIRRVRIERAKRELAQSRRPLNEIARDAGFGTIQRLYEVFRREVGVPPTQYRKERTMTPSAK